MMDVESLSDVQLESWLASYYDAVSQDLDMGEFNASKAHSFERELRLRRSGRLRKVFSIR